MDREEIIRMAREQGLPETETEGVFRVNTDDLGRMLAAERNKLADWMIERGYATGHGDTVEDLLKELEWQIAEREREACASICFQEGPSIDGELIAEAIRARGEK